VTYLIVGNRRTKGFRFFGSDEQECTILQIFVMKK